MTLRPVVLLHGCGGSPEQAFGRSGWLAAFEGSGRSVRALRLPGHGRDNPSHAPADYADLTSMLVRDLPEEACDIVGFSLGAKLALDVAVRFPARVHRMVLGGIGDNVFAPETVGDAAAHALKNGPDEHTPPPVRDFLATWDPALNDALAIAAVLQRPHNPVLTEADIAAIRAPVAVVNGGTDFVASLGTRLVDALAIQPLLLPKVGHFDLTERPEFRDFALRFIAEGASTED